MIWNLNSGWLMMAVASVAVLAFLRVGPRRHHARGRVRAARQHGAIHVRLLRGGLIANTYGISLNDLKLAVAWGLGGAFAMVSVLALAQGRRRPDRIDNPNHLPDVAGNSPVSLSAPMPVSRKLLDSLRPSGPRISR